MSKTGGGGGIQSHIRRILQEGGAASFYRGLPFPLAGTMFETACLFFTMGRIKHYFYGSSTAPLSALDTSVCGAMCGLCVSFVLTPVELVKCRMQVRPDHASSWKCMSHAIQSEGWKVLYKGHVATICREVPGSAAWFGAYEGSLRVLEEYFFDDDRRLDPNIDIDVGQHVRKKDCRAVILAGAIAGIAYNTAFYPADTIKTHLQIRGDTRTSVTQVMQQIYAQNQSSVWGFYRGLAPTLVRAIPANAAVFYTYETIVASFNLNSE